MEIKMRTVKLKINDFGHTFINNPKAPTGLHGNCLTVAITEVPEKYTDTYVKRKYDQHCIFHQKEEYSVNFNDINHEGCRLVMAA